MRPSYTSAAATPKLPAEMSGAVLLSDFNTPALRIVKSCVDSLEHFDVTPSR